MKNYIIVTTWNGSGYSEENKIVEVREFKGPAEALCRCIELSKSEDYEQMSLRDNGVIFEIGKVAQNN